MSEFGASFAGLVKSNGGLFKSEKQAHFLLSRCDGETYIAGGHSGYAFYQLHYRCDALGVVEVSKYTAARGMLVQWQRPVEGMVPVQDQKEVKRLTRMRKQLEKDLAERHALMSLGKWESRTLFDEVQARDLKSIEEIDDLLSRLG
jgi:hypothetical protein